MKKKALVQYSDSSSSSNSPAPSKKEQLSKRPPSPDSRSPNRGNRPKEMDRRKDKRLLDEELKRIEKEKIEEEYDRWKLKEDEFLKRQLIEQSKIRIAARREEPIDHFMNILFIYKRDIKVDEDTNVEILKHPKKILDRLGKVEVESLLEKCEIYKKIEKSEDFQKFWTHVKSLAQAQLERLTKYEQRRRGNVNIQGAIADEYNEDIESLIVSKNIKQLEELEEKAKQFRSGTDVNVDVEFWDQVMTRVQVQKAVLGMESLHAKYFEGKGNKDEYSGANPTKAQLATVQPTSLVMEPPKADPLSPRAYTGASLGITVKTFSAEEYRKRLDTLRDKSYKRELALLVKQAEKEIEIRKTKDHLLDHEDQEVSDDDVDLNEETRRFRELLGSEENKLEDDELAFDDYEGEGQKVS